MKIAKTRGGFHLDCTEEYINSSQREPYQPKQDVRDHILVGKPCYTLATASIFASSAYIAHKSTSTSTQRRLRSPLASVDKVNINSPATEGGILIPAFSLFDSLHNGERRSDREVKSFLETSLDDRIAETKGTSELLHLL